MFRSGISFDKLANREQIIKAATAYVTKQDPASTCSMLSKSSQKLVSDCLAQVKLLVDGLLFAQKDFMMEVDQGSQAQSLLELDIPQFKVRQALSREICKLYQFDKVSVSFNRQSPLFTVKLLEPLTKGKVKEPEEHFDYDAATSDESMTEAASLAFQIESELERQQEVEIANLVNYELGFSLVIHEIIKAKKPLVGHNLFLDLLFLYNQFIDELPDHLG